MTRVAAVDVGTNSVRLLVADVVADELVSHCRQMVITRLGRGVDRRGRLDDDALARTLDVLDGFGQAWRELGAERVRITATSAIRDASDRERFFAGVRRGTGVEAEVLSGEEEAATAFVGATRGLDAPSPFLVLDIGGGSTEFIYGSAEPEIVTSRQLGCVRLTERHLAGDPPTPAQVQRAIGDVDAEVDAVVALLGERRPATLVGVAGTVTTLGALSLGLERYEPERIHGTRVSRGQVGALTRTLAGMSAAQRAELGPMAPGREDVIVGGAIVLDRVMERLDIDEVLVSESDILDGLAWSLADRPSA